MICSGLAMPVQSLTGPFEHLKMLNSCTVVFGISDDTSPVLSVYI